MAGGSKAVKLDNNSRSGKGAPAGSRPLPRKVQSLVAKASYASPKVVSFPIDGMKVSQVSLAGNS